MKTIKTLAKRSLAVILAVMMCAGMIQLPAYAATVTEATDLTGLNGNSIKLTADVTVSGTVTITSNSTLDLNGHTVKLADGATGSVFHVKSGTFTLKDSKGTGKITGGKGTLIEKGDSGWNVGSSKGVTDPEVTGADGKKYAQNGYAAIIGGSRKNVTCGGAILLTDKAKLVMYGGNIYNNTAAMGGGICAFRSADVTIYGGTIEQNTADGYGGGGLFLSSKNNLIDPTEKNTDINIINNTTTTAIDLGGGGLFLDSWGELQIINAVITENTASGLGGGVAGCLHAMVSNLAPDTAAIYGNSASGANTLNNLVDHDEPRLEWNDNLKSDAQDLFVAGYSTIGSRSLGGASAQWVGTAVLRNGGKSNVKFTGKDNTGKVSTDTTNPLRIQGLLGLTVTNAEKVQKAEWALNAKKVYINSNHSNMHGGGVGTNGILTFGEKSFYYSTTEITINAAKAVTNNIGTGDTEAKDGFNFELWKGNTLLATATSDEEGKIVFSGLLSSDVFGVPDTLPEKPTKTTVTATLTLKEVDDGKTGMYYDGIAREITLTADRTINKPETAETHGGGNKVSVSTIEDEVTKVSVDKGSASVGKKDNIVTLSGAANFTNTMKYGKLRLTKELSNPEYDNGDVFTFTVKIGDDVIPVTLKAGEEWISDYYPVDTEYTVTETSATGYTNETGKVNGKIQDNETHVTEVKYTNKRDTADLTVKKTVEYNPTTSVAPGDDTFTIVVTLNNGSTKPGGGGKGSYTYDPTDPVGVYTFTLKDTESATITGIPTGTTYTVTESAVGDQYYTGKSGEVTNATLSDSKTVEIVNHYYKAKTTELTVTKVWASNDYKPTSITVNLLQDGEVYETAVLNEGNNWSESWSDLPQYAGENSKEGHVYTVEEVSVSYSAENPLPEGWTALKEDDGIIRVRTGKAAIDGSGREIVGGWRARSNTVQAVDKGTITLTNTWVPAIDLGSATLVVKKVDHDTNEAINSVMFLLKDANGSTVGTKTTRNGGIATFEGLTVGTYTLEEYVVPEWYDNGVNLHNTWTITVDKDGDLIEVEVVSDKATENSNGEKVVGENHWNWKVTGDDVKAQPTEQNGNTVTIGNEIIKGRIRITKYLNLDGETDIDKEIIDRVFVFEVHAAEATKNGKYAAGQLVDTLTVKAGETDTTIKLPYGKYYIVEVGDTALTDYRWEGVEYTGGTLTERGLEVFISEQKDEPYAVTATNSYKRDLGEMQVTKVVTGDQGDTTANWHFTVTLKSDIPYVNLVKGGEVNYTAFPFAITIGGEDAGVAFEVAGINSIKAVITLKSGQTATISGIPVGVTYSVTEREANLGGYTTSSRNASGRISTDNTPLARFVNEKWSTGLSVVKVWVGDDEEVRPDSIDVVLYRDGRAYETVTLDEDNDWSYRWTDLDNIYTWTVGEYEVPEDYDSDITHNDTAWTITNTYTRRLTIDVTVNKEWDGDNAETRPEGILVQLYDGNETYGEPVLLTAETGWTYTWEDLSIHGDWSVLEVEVPDGYEATYSKSETENGIVLTITNSGSVEVSVVKEWDDEDDADGIRPDYVTVRLYRGIFLHDEVTLDESNNWSYTWTDLPLGYDYRVEEVDVPEGYDESYDQDGNVWTITNTHIPDEEFEIIEDDVPLAPGIPQGPDEVFEIPEDDVPLAAVPQTGDESRSWGFFAVISGIGLALMALFRKKQEDSAEEE